MAQEWLFWGMAAAGLVLALGVVLTPLWRGATRGGRGERRASYDLQVHRDQLREVEADLARGVLTPAEAEASRVEISRRLIAAADAEAIEAGAATAPRRVTRVALPLLAIGLAGAALGLYRWLGVPGLPDQPLAERTAEAAVARANRPSQSAAEAMAPAAPATPGPGPADAALIDKLEAVLKDRPDDLQGHRLLARSLGSLGRWREARVAQERVVALLGDAATADDLVDLAEAQVLAANGYVSPEAEAVLGRALTLAPQNPVARYYSGLALLEAGRADLAYPLWLRLAEEGPADAPWMTPTRAGLAEAARQLGMPDPAPATSGPSADDLKAAGDLPPEARQSMVEGMVARLSDRLASEGGPPADWAQLVRSLAVLGRRDEATAVVAEARQTFATDAAGLALIDAAAGEAGLPAAAP
ncbi:MAG: c-type cytochrome biogenesis protein CcmI [Amaricoccus sp.]|uniref:c-type cytochrome biogenesis protein CcmI n=1 Tax=Amaricoccus sp. TaxID=1872485 RepID=UPI0039E5604D